MHGVQWDKEKDEPFLAHSDYPALRVTPFREDDGAEWHRYVNIPEIGKRSRGAPYPSTLEMASERASTDAAASQPAVSKLREALASGSLQNAAPLLACPFDIIREGDRIVGRLGCRPFEHDFRGITLEQMLAFPPKEQTWSLGWSLDPAYQGKGIMVSFAKLLIEEWIKPYMRVGRLECGIETNNTASMALAKKLGFKVEITAEVPWDDGTREINVCFRELA